MLNRIYERLALVRVRQQFSRGIRWGVLGYLAGSLVGVGWIVLHRADIVSSASEAWWCLLILTVAAFVTGLLWTSSWESAAKRIDDFYGLKDRTITALEFARREEPSRLQMLQVEDALKHLKNVDAKQVVPTGMPRYGTAAMGCFVLFVALALMPSRTPTLLVAEANPVVLEQASLLEESMLRELKDLAKEFDDQELQELTRELDETLEELKQPEVDQREALAKLSEMQQSIAEAMKQMDVEQIDAQLEQLAAALEAAQATEAASQALRGGEYDKAAKELEKITASSMTRKERDAVANNLAKLSKKLGDGKQGELSDAITELAEGIENENESQCKSGACKAAGVCRKQAIKKTISQCLACQLNRLSECKSSCQGQCSNPGSKVAKSDSPSNKAGMGASNNPYGEDKTKLDSTRREESITGMAGEGPSERETISTPEAKQDAARAYETRYAEFRKQVEEVLDSEPLPLGHRQTVRTYFEAIRPENNTDL